ncbi:MAG: hypothetical protein ACM3VV_01430 [Deltaproteobacteria bacterium]
MKDIIVNMFVPSYWLSYGLITTRQFSQPLTKFEEVRESKSYIDDDYSC